jgi:hypothetical protein
MFCHFSGLIDPRCEVILQSGIERRWGRWGAEGVGRRRFTRVDLNRCPAVPEPGAPPEDLEDD